MKTLVAYYSRTGITKKIAEDIAHRLGADIERIIDTKDRSGALGFMSGGKDAATKSLTKIKPVDKEPQVYDLVVVGTPLWVGTMAPAVRTYLHENMLSKKTAFFFTAGAGGQEKAFDDMHKLSHKSKCLAKLSLSSKELKLGPSEKIEHFIKTIKNEK
jgi:flavodoxin